MSDIEIRKEGRAGVVTLNRPQALNALTYEMCLALDDALKSWRDDDEVALVLIEGAGERAFCAGGDIAQMYATGMAGDYAYGQRFWRDEYRMNARIAEYPKPVVSLLHGFTMGGGVGLGCHGSHRVVCESSQIAMPECGIGLIPDVGGSYLLAMAPGRLGEYLGTTGARMGPADAILAGFADSFVPAAHWPELRARLIAEGGTGVIGRLRTPPPEGRLATLRHEIDVAFGADPVSDFMSALEVLDGDFGEETKAALRRSSPLSMAVTLEILNRLRHRPSLRAALALEYRFTYRALEHADFLEGIRAQIIDKDRNPSWRHKCCDVPVEEVGRMLAPLGEAELTFEEEESA